MLCFLKFVKFFLKNGYNLVFKSPNKQERFGRGAKNKFKDICLEVKSFQGEAVLTKTDYPKFNLTAEDASGGGEYRLEIYCDDDQSFEGTVANKEKLIEEFSDYLINKGVIKTKGEKKSIKKATKKATKKKVVKKAPKKKAIKKVAKKKSAKKSR